MLIAMVGTVVDPGSGHSHHEYR